MRKEKYWMALLLFSSALAGLVTASIEEGKKPGVKGYNDLYNRPKWWIEQQLKNASGWAIGNVTVDGLPCAYITKGESTLVLPSRIEWGNGEAIFSSEAYCINDAGLVGGKIIIRPDKYSSEIERGVVWYPSDTGYQVLDLTAMVEEGGKDQSFTSVRSFKPTDPNVCAGYLDLLYGRQKQYFWLKLRGVS